MSCFFSEYLAFLDQEGSPRLPEELDRVFSLLSVVLQAHCEPTFEGGVVAPQNQFNVKSSWEKRTEL